jgi:hypothetical protein
VWFILIALRLVIVEVTCYYYYYYYYYYYHHIIIISLTGGCRFTCRTSYTEADPRKRLNTIYNCLTLDVSLALGNVFYDFSSFQFGCFLCECMIISLLSSCIKRIGRMLYK